MNEKYRQSKAQVLEPNHHRLADAAYHRKSDFNEVNPNPKSISKESKKSSKRASTAKNTYRASSCAPISTCKDKSF